MNAPLDPHFAARCRQSFGRQKAMALIGARLGRVEPGAVEIALAYRDDITQQKGFVHGGVGLRGFTESAIRDERVLALAAKVKFVIDPDNPYPNNYTGHIRATLRDGSVVEDRQPYLRGGAQEPLTRQDVIDKFRLNAEHGGWSAAQSDAALKLLAGLYNGRIDLSSLRG